MDQAFRDLIEFESRCGHPPTNDPPGIPDERTQALRIRLITEEYVELTTALTAGDLPEIADGIADLIYVCIGTAVRLGINLVPVWHAIQKGNLAKFGPGSYRHPDGKQAKPKDWVHPDIAAILASQRPLSETYGKATGIDSKPFVGDDSTEAMVIIPVAQNERERLPWSTYVWQCTECGWTGPEERTVRDPRGGGPVCPQCKALGYDSLVEKVAWAYLPPKGSEP